ncbi:hypothetical protein C0992_010490 [Termitomyces sp. T32_za158]|nr:hypothetical protein C0992_010490 [Termitomyces sp. T32_za158]
MHLKILLVFAFLPVLLFAQTTPAQIERDISNGLVPALVADIATVDAFPIDGGTLDEAMGPNIQKALTDITAREPGFEAVGAVPIIRDDISILQASSDAMGAALLDCVSPNIAPEVQAFQSAIDAGFAGVVAVFN